MGGSRLLNTNNHSKVTNIKAPGSNSASNAAASIRQDIAVGDSITFAHREDDSGNGSQGSDSFHSHNLSQFSNIRKCDNSNITKSSGGGITNLIQRATKRTFFRRRSGRKGKSKTGKSDSSNKQLEISNSIRASKPQPTIYGGHFNGGGSISKRRTSQKRRRRLSNARKFAKSQEAKNRILTKADIGQPIPMDEDEKQNVISAKQWPTSLNPLKPTKSSTGL